MSNEQALRAQEWEPRPNITLKVGGKPFRCHCGCNVFHDVTPSIFGCNGCPATYESEDDNGR